MKRIKKEDIVVIYGDGTQTNKENLIEIITDDFGRADLNSLRDKLNEVIKRIN